MARSLLFLVLMAVTVALAGAADQRALVFADGTSLEVTDASCDGGLVYATFANGSMQAYPLEDVDLAASGLAPAPAAAPAAKKAPTIVDAQATVTGNGVAITDDDVEHVTPAEPAAATGEEEAKKAEGPAATALLISDVQRQIAAGMVNLTGKVKNAGTESVAMITLTATALEGERVAGKGSTTINQELKPQAEVGFALTFPVEGLVSNVQLRAQAAMVDFDFKPVPAATPAPSGETSSSGG